LSVRLAFAVAAGLLLAALLLIWASVAAGPLTRTCAPEMGQAACDSAIEAVLRRGLPPLHPLILGAHAEPGAAPGPQDLGHRATVTFDLLGVPGPTSVALYFDRGAHWGGVPDRDAGQVAAWTLAPLILAGLLGALTAGLAWHRRRVVTATG